MNTGTVWPESKVLAKGLLFPEGPVALSDGSVLLVEVGRGTLSRVLPGSQKAVIVAECGGGPNGAAIGPDGAAYICNNGGIEFVAGRWRRVADVGGSIQRVDISTGHVVSLYTEVAGHTLLAPNDLVFDSTGGFWFTDTGHAVGSVERPTGAIYYAQPDGSRITKAVDNLSHPNGIGLSPEGDVLYWAETVERSVRSRRIEAPGQLAPMPGSHPWTTVAVLSGTAQLDSLAVERRGHICVGQLNPGGIVVVNPNTGLTDLRTPPADLAEKYVTNICFGGDDMSTAFIICSESGTLVSSRWPEPGLNLAFNA
jgi:gluconolactonase